jgi:predicted amidophosphoribosyltransferase
VTGEAGRVYSPGTDLRQPRCHRCGAGLQGDFRYCPQCGASLR